MMGDLVVLGLCHMQTLFGVYEQFKSSFCNICLMGNVHNFLWNGALVCMTCFK